MDKEASNIMASTGAPCGPGMTPLFFGTTDPIPSFIDKSCLHNVSIDSNNFYIYSMPEKLVENAKRFNCVL